MGEYVIVFAQYLTGISEVKGMFESEYRANQWIDRHIEEYPLGTTYVVMPVEKIRLEPDFDGN